MPSARYRPPGTSRRAPRNTAQHDHHDVFEGLPVRSWRKQWVAINPPPNPNNPNPANPANATSGTELPLPKETHLLTPMSQALLQAARAGTLESKPKPAKAAAAASQGQLFMTKRWMRGGEVVEDKKGLLGKMPDTIRKRRRVKRRIDGKIVVSYLDEEIAAPQVVGHTSGGGHSQREREVQAPATGGGGGGRRRPPPKRKQPRGRKPGGGAGGGRKVKFMDEVTQQQRVNEANAADAKAEVAAAAAATAAAAETAAEAEVATTDNTGDAMDVDKPAAETTAEASTSEETKADGDDGDKPAEAANP
ncbi:hypothetical protein DFH27DRAFT_528126 [Peziza echinospora]|nr:hypothetical protein DFH27DRAFT_528126 [Peziza echinospora]